MKIRKIQESDLPFVNSVRNHESTRSRLKNTNEISLEKTYKWFESEKPPWKIIEVGGKSVGYFRFSHDTGETICMGCDIHPDFRRRGHAKEAYIKEIDSEGQTEIIDVGVVDCP